MEPDKRVTWDDATIERLMELWKLKVTSTAIAKELGLTRNAVMGKVHRLGLFGKGPPKRLLPAGKGRKPRMSTELSLDVPRETSAPQESAPKVVGPCKLVDLTPNSCRWPIGDPADWDDFHFCGAGVHGRGPYCTKHFKQAWGKTAAPTTNQYYMWKGSGKTT